MESSKLAAIADDANAAFAQFAHEEDAWTPLADVQQALMAEDDFGDPVDGRTATALLKELCANGYVERRAGACRPALPSLAAHLETVRRSSPPEEGHQP